METGNGKCNAKRSCLGSALALFGILFSALWMLNLSGGIIEVPDNLPIIGNLDEAFFMMVLISSLAYFGVTIPFINKTARTSVRSGKDSDKRLK